MYTSYYKKESQPSISFLLTCQQKSFWVLVYRSDVQRFCAALDWDLIGFFVILFIVINVMEHAKVLALLRRGIAALVEFGDLRGRLALLWGSAITSSVTDNIPLAAVLAKILANFSPRLGPDSPL